MRSLRSFHLLLVLAIGVVAVPFVQQSGERTIAEQHAVQEFERKGGHFAGPGAAAVVVPQAAPDRARLPGFMEFQAALDAPPAQR